jgi:hypothetical protein
MDGGASLWVAYASLAAAAAGAAVSAVGAHQQGVAAQQQAAYQAAVARNNQVLAEQAANDATAKGRVLEQQKRQQVAQQEGMVRAVAGASGFDENSGSPLRIQESVAQVGEEDAQIIRNNAAREAYGYRTQGMNYAAQAGLDEAEGRNAATAGNLGAFSSIIGGASTVSSRWTQFNKEGVWSR